VIHDRYTVRLPMLGVPGRAARPRHYPLAAFPPSFVNELERYLSWMADPRNGTGRVSQPSTIRQRRTELRLAASALAEVWGDPGRINTLRVLVVPANTRIILEAYLRRADQGEPTAFVRTLTTNLIALARHWTEPAPEEFAQLLAFQRMLGTTPAGLTAYTQQLLQQLADPELRAALLALPFALAAHAGERGCRRHGGSSAHGRGNGTLTTHRHALYHWRRCASGNTPLAGRQAGPTRTDPAAATARHSNTAGRTGSSPVHEYPSSWSEGRSA
jgi:hypothetical protein